jgi:hypothetical protein
MDSIILGSICQGILQGWGFGLQGADAVPTEEHRFDCLLERPIHREYVHADNLGAEVKALSYAFE